MRASHIGINASCPAKKELVEGHVGAGTQRINGAPKAIFTRNRSAPETGTSAKWFGNIRVQ